MKKISLFGIFVFLISACDVTGPTPDPNPSPSLSPSPSPTPDTRVWATLGDAGFSPGTVSAVSLAANSAGVVHAAYSDGNAAGKVSVQRFDGTDWSLVGSAGFTPASFELHLVFDSSDTAFVVYKDSGNGDKASAKTFNGTDWESVGTAGFSAGEVGSSIGLVAAPNHILYAAFDGDDHAEVYRFNGTDWTDVTPADDFDDLRFIAGSSIIAADSTGRPYIIAMDTGAGDKATVMKYSGAGTGWSLVGQAGFSSEDIFEPSISIDSQDLPYVTYAGDPGNLHQASVMQFTGTNWELVGAAHINPLGSQSPVITIDSSDRLFVSYQGYDSGDFPLGIKKFDGTNWIPGGNAGSSTISASASAISFIAGPSNKLYIGFSDQANGQKATVLVYE